jgi:hypothetical protein
MSQMDQDQITGGCRRGLVRYTLATDKLPPAYACHCLDCQTWSGSAFSQQCLVPESKFRLTGKVELYRREGSGGRISSQYACGMCYTRVYNTNSARPGIVVLRAGTLDHSDELDCVAHIWAKRKQKWIGIQPGMPVWPEGAPAEDFMRALSHVW